MEQLSLPFKDAIEILADELLAEQTRLNQWCFFPREHLIKIIKEVGLEGWHLEEDPESEDFSFILWNGEDIS